MAEDDWNLVFHRNRTPLDSVSGLLDLSLLYHVWLCGVFLLVTWYITWVLFKIYATEVSVDGLPWSLRLWAVFRAPNWLLISCRQVFV